MRRSSARLPLVALAAWAAVLLAAPPSGAVDWDLETHGHLRYRHIQMSDFALGADGEEHGQVLRDLLRLHGGGTLYLTREFWARATLEVADAQILGDDSAVRGDYPGAFFRSVPLRDQLFLREAFAQVPIGLGTVRVGRMPLHWGMGLVVNDGESPAGPFGQPWGGDIVNGVRADVLPLLPFLRGRVAHAVRLRLDVSLVERDDQADRTDGDVASRFSGALLWEEPTLVAGILAVRRNVRRDGGDQIVTSILDLAARWQRPLSRYWTLRIAGEVVALSGSVELEGAAPGDDLDGRLAGFGAATRVDFVREIRTGEVVWSAEVGVASGDDDPLDDRDTSLRFDPAHDVGMILFDEVLARTSARGRRDLAGAVDDPRAARLTSTQPTEGGVRGAAYLAPEVRATFCSGCFEARAGGVVAVATDPLVDPSAVAVGAPAGWYGEEPEGGVLGYEVTAGASLGLPLETPRMSVGTDYGVFFPGPALEGPGDDDGPGVVHAWRVRADLAW